MDEEEKAQKVARNDDERRAIESLFRLIDQARALRDQPGVSEKHRTALGEAADAARDALKRYIAKHEQGKTRAEMMERIGYVAGGVAANDTTGVGIADDWVLIVCAVAALANMVLSQKAATKGEIDEAWIHVGDRLEVLESTVRVAMDAAAIAEEKCPDDAGAGGSAAAGQAQPGARGSVDVAPAPASDRSEPERKHRTCETAFPDQLECWTLPNVYEYSSAATALREMKARTGNHSLKLHTREDTATGPCPEKGDHYNVRAGSQRAGSITCCPCCSDDPGGPAMEEKCRIVW